MNTPRAVAATALFAVLLIVFSSTAVADASDESVEVSNWSELQTALAGTCDTIKLTDNIESQSQIVMRQNLTIDGQGHTIKAVYETAHENIVLIQDDGCVLRNITLDNNDYHDGVLVTCCKDVVLDNLEITCSEAGTCALNIDRAEVSIKSDLKMSDNGDNMPIYGDGDCILLQWKGNYSPVERCSVAFDPDGSYPVSEYDGINAVIRSEELSRAGVTAGTWEQKFSVTDSGKKMCTVVYGEGEHACVVVNNGIASVDGVRYASINEAANRAMVSGRILMLTQSIKDGGIVTGGAHGRLDIDLNGFEYVIMHPVGVPKDDIHPCDYIECGDGAKVTIRNGTISNVMNSCSLLIDTLCDLELVNVSLDATELTTGEPYHSEFAYAVSVRGGTLTFDGVTVMAEKHQDYQHSVILRGETVKFVVKGETKIQGTLDVVSDSTVEVFGDLMIPFGDAGRNYQIRLTKGNIIMHDGSKLYAEIDSGKGMVDIDNAYIIGGLTVTSSPFSVTGMLSGDNSVRCGVMICQSSSDASEMRLDLVVRKCRMSMLCNIPVNGNITILGDSEYDEMSGGKLVSGTDGLHLILMEGSMYKETRVEATRVNVVGTDGSLEEQIRAQFVTGEHCFGIRYYGTYVNYLEAPATEGGFILDLSKLSVNADNGYSLKGWKVGDRTCSLDEKVFVSGNVYVEPVMESDRTLTAGVAIAIAIVAVLAIVGFVAKKD